MADLTPARVKAGAIHTAHVTPAARAVPVLRERQSHMAMYNDANCYFDGLLKFLRAPALAPLRPRSLRSC